VLDIRPYGERAALLTLATSEEALAWYENLRAVPVPGTEDVVLGARTVLIVFADEQAARAGAGSVDNRRPEPVTIDTGVLVEMSVVYDGADLAAVADHSGMTVAEVVRIHQSVEYRVAFVGFTPGFGYLTGLPTALHVPRRASPRTRVPAGSVAIAGEYAAVYPRESPGGWNLVGRAEIPMWDLARDPPAVLQPGMRVRFVDGQQG
jgi:5-oxoprolinase (ATP-hydrolysing) subunit B